MDALDRLYRRIVAALDAVPREPRGIPATIGELYQTLAPYRAVRGDAGFAELAQYEHTLLRLLAGEREYVRLERDEVQDEFRRELAAPNPILGLYRDYSDAALHVNPHLAAHLPDEPRPAGPPPRAAGPGGPGAPPAPPSTAPRPAAGARPRPAAAPDVPAAEPPAPRPTPCPTCRSPLPVGKEPRFCPFCGRPLRPIPCAECSAMLEPDWSFCAQCGSHRPEPPLPPSEPERRLR